jgi:hypothetical protein
MKGKASAIVMSAEERRELESLARRCKTGQALALRSRIVLASAEGGDNRRIAERLERGRTVSHLLAACPAPQVRVIPSDPIMP